MRQKTAYLVLADGTVFQGKSFGAAKNSQGEVIFNTAITGYQEVLSDPANYGQIMTMTYPLIGNYGINRDDFESLAPVIHGLVVKEWSTYPSNWRKESTLAEFLQEYDIPGIYDLDTRKLTRLLRDQGSMSGMIVVEENPDVGAIQSQLTTLAPFRDQVAQVSTKSPYHIPGTGKRVVVLDFGIKASILRELTKRNCDLLVLPFNSSVEEIIRWKPDGVLLSNGPGNPLDLPEAIEMVRNILGRFPLLGISLGHQLLALACGAKVEKLKHGHRGTNYPIKNVRTEKTILTTQNHGYTVSAGSLTNTELEVSYINVNDQSIEGVYHKHHPAFSVQFQPESTLNFNYSDSIFDQFIEMMHVQLKEGETYATF